MKRKRKPIISPFIQDTEALIKASVNSLRNSFAIEGVFFTDEEIKAMVDEVLRKKAIQKS